MKAWIYHLLVNRVPGIRDRYLHQRQNTTARWKVLFYLLWLNVQYYLLFRRSLGRPERFPFYEEKRLYSGGSESSLSERESPEAFAAKLMSFDVISMDVFDTLLFRPFSEPADLFYLVGMELCYPDFRQIRIDAEEQARKNKQRETGTREVTFQEIWEEIERETGIPKERGMQVESSWELRCCFANPYMLRVVKALQAQGKAIVATSDMYLPSGFIQELLHQCGYGTLSNVFVSCEFGASKSDGHLYEKIRKRFGEAKSYVHVGDNRHSDLQEAQRHRMEAILYPNVHQQGNRFRPEDMSSITGSIYRGIVNAQMHNGLSSYSQEYEYGFIYGGLFVAGYCQFIHDYVKAHDIEKILFLSRDGSVLMQAYRRVYPDETETTQYVYWSRLAATKLTAGYYKEAYFRRFLFHKTDQTYTVRQILESMELGHLLEPLCHTVEIEPDVELTYKNVGRIKKYLIDIWEQVLDAYQEQVDAGKAYYSQVLQGCRSAAAVDIGWAGSGAISLDAAVNRLWGLRCDITGILAGTNSCYSPEPDTGEAFLFQGKLVSYLYSQSENRDLWKFHDPAQNHNLYWELLLGAPEGSLKGFYWDRNGHCECRFKESRADAARIREIHRGILDFVQQFLEVERRLGCSIPIHGRDAYAPMLSVCSRKNKAFRKGLEGLMDEIHIA